MVVYFSIPVFFAVIILAACGVFLADVVTSIWGFAVSSLSSSSSQVKAWWHSRPVLLFRLGGVTTLRQKLNDPFAMCQDSMEPGEKVRTLSCNHMFHYGATVKCQKTLDEWLLKEEMSCPICRGISHPVLPWNWPPPSLLVLEEEEEEEEEEEGEEEEEDSEEFLLPSHWFDETLL